jgi:hypothetical protein
MADLKISQLTDYTPAVDTDVMPIVDTTLTTTKKITWANIKATLKSYFDGIYSTGVVPTKATAGELDTGTDDAKFATALAIAGRAEKDGWTPAREAWAYASATTITVPSGAASKYHKGDKIKYTAGAAVHYHYIITVADTLLTVCGDAVHNDTMTLNYYSHQSNPLDFPDQFDWVPTLSGGNTDISGYTEATFCIKGRTLFFIFNATAKNLSGSAGVIVVTLPVVGVTNITQEVWEIYNGSAFDHALVTVDPSSATISFYKTVAAGNWVANETGVQIFCKGFYEI